jgi:uncharacterized protein (UPF0305 family)
MFKEMLMKRMLKKQLKGLPPQEQERITELVMKNPEFFEKISKEIKQKTDQGKDQMAATMEVMRKNQAELQRLLGGQ